MPFVYVDRLVREHAVFSSAAWGQDCHAIDETKPLNGFFNVPLMGSTPASELHGQTGMSCASGDRVRLVALGHLS